MILTDRKFYYAHPSDIIGDQFAITTTGAADSAYPLANAVDFGFAKLAAPAKLTSVSGDLLFNGGSAKRVDGVIIWHDFKEALAFSFDGHTANSWGTPTISVSPTVGAKRADGYTTQVFIDFRQEDGYDVAGLQWWRLNVSGTNDAPIGVKVMFISNLREADRDFEWNPEEADHQVGIKMTTDALHPWNYDLTSAPRGLSAQAMWTDALDTAMREWFRSCAGGVKVTAMVPNPSSGEGRIVLWNEGPSAAVVSPSIAISRLSSTHQHLDGHVMRMSWLDVTAGDPEWY